MYLREAAQGCGFNLHHFTAVGCQLYKSVGGQHHAVHLEPGFAGNHDVEHCRTDAVEVPVFKNPGNLALLGPVIIRQRHGFRFRAEKGFVHSQEQLTRAAAVTPFPAEPGVFQPAIDFIAVEPVNSPVAAVAGGQQVERQQGIGVACPRGGCVSEGGFLEGGKLRPDR